VIEVLVGGGRKQLRGAGLREAFMPGAVWG